MWSIGCGLLLNKVWTRSAWSTLRASSPVSPEIVLAQLDLAYLYALKDAHDQNVQVAVSPANQNTKHVIFMRVTRPEDAHQPMFL